MPDIAMCKNDSCPLKGTCYRFLATPGVMQYYQSFTYDEGCTSYTSVEK